MAQYLNFRIPANLTLTIGGVNFTDHLAGLGLSRPLPEPGTPQSWTGNISLTTPAIPALVAETLDPATNPNYRWEKGCHQIILAIGGSRLCPPLYILRYSYQEPTDTLPARAELQVGDDLALRSDYQPAQDYQTLAFDPTESPTVKAIVQRALSSVGLSNYSLGVSGTVPVAPGKPEGSFIGFAQKYLGERGRWVYLHTDGQVRDAAWPAVDASTIFAYPRSGVEIWEPIDSDVPKEVYRVNGSCEKFVPNSSPVGTTIEKEYDDLPGIGTVLIKTTTTEILSDSPFYFRRRVTVDTALHALNPQVFEGNLTTSRTITEEEHTADAQGQVIQITTTASAPLAPYLPDLVEELAGSASAGALLPYYINRIPNIEKSVETFTAGLNNVMSRRQKVTYRPVRFGATTYVVTSVERESESWAGNTAGFSLDGNDPPSNYYTRTYQRSLRAASVQKDDGTYLVRPLSVKESRVEPGQSPASFNTLRPSAETGQVAVTGEATFLPASVSPYYQQVEQLSTETLSTTAECNAFATVVGRLAHEAYRGRKFNCPIPAEWLANPAPFRVAAVHDGVFVLCNDTITLSGNELEICWQGYRLGYLASVVPETGSWTPATPTPPIIPRVTVARTGETPVIRMTVATGDWQRGGTVERTGTTPVISLTAGTGTWNVTKERTGETPVISLTVGTGTWSVPVIVNSTVDPALAKGDVRDVTSTATSTPNISSTVDPALSTGDVRDATSTATAATLKLLLHLNGSDGSTTFTDDSLSPVTFSANGSAALSTTQKKFGTASLKLVSGGSSYISASDSKLALGSGDFTVEFWAYRVTDLSYLLLYDTRSTRNNGHWVTYFTNDNKLAIYFDGDAEYKGSTTVTNATWHHVAICRSGTTLRVFLNGTQQVSLTKSTDYTNQGVQIGADYDYTSSSEGYIDEVRILVGEAAYTSGFTPPSSEF